MIVAISPCEKVLARAKLFLPPPVGAVWAKTLADGAGREASIRRQKAMRRDRTNRRAIKPSHRNQGLFFGKLARRCSTPEGGVSEKLPMVRNAVLCTPCGKQESRVRKG